MNSIKLDKKEVYALLFISFFCIIALPLLPNHPIDPWQLFNPFRFAILVTVLAGIQFTGHIAIHAFGEKLGMMILGFFGGLISSTVVIASLPKIVENNRELRRPAIGAALFANIGMLVELTIIIYIIAPTIIKYMALPIGCMILFGALTSFALIEPHHKPTPLSKSINSFDIKTVIKLSLLIAIMIFIVGLIQQKIGTQALMLAAFFGGLFELHSVSLATANLYVEHSLSLQQAMLILSLAILSSHITKFILLALLARNKFGLYTATHLLAMLLVGAMGLWIVYSYLS